MRLSVLGGLKIPRVISEGDSCEWMTLSYEIHYSRTFSMEEFAQDISNCSQPQALSLGVAAFSLRPGHLESSPAVKRMLINVTK